MAGYFQGFEMPLRRKIDRNNFLTLNGITYNFQMHNHLNHQPSISEGQILTKICNVISRFYEGVVPIWPRLEDDFRIFDITEEDELDQYLDEDARRNHFNFLIFERENDIITVTHFGPFGDEENEMSTKLIEKIQRELRILKEMWRFKSQNHIEVLREQFWAPLPRLELDLEAKKEELSNLTDSLYEDSNDRENAMKLIGTINVKASTGKVVIKSITAILFAELAEEIAKKIAGKAAAKTAAKVAAKSGSKGSGKMASKAVPFLGLAVGTAFGVWRLCQGDLTGASLEVASGAASCVPGTGTALSLAIDAGLLAKDISQAREESDQNLKKLTTRMKEIQCDLNNLSDDYEKALAEYDFVEKILDSPRLSAEQLKHEIENQEKTLFALRNSSLTRSITSGCLALKSL